MTPTTDPLILGGHSFSSRILGSGKYSLDLIKSCIENAGAQIITLALRRANQGGLANILDYIPDNSHTASQYLRRQNRSRGSQHRQTFQRGRMRRFCKIEIMRDTKYLLPDNDETVNGILAKEGFVVMPYMYPDLNTARDLDNAGAATVMPLAAPIGTNKGLCTKEFIQILIDEIDLPIIVDAE